VTPGAHLAAAIEILADIDARHRPVAEALKDWGTSHRFAGSGDRSAIGNVVYDALRHRRSAGWIVGEETPRALVLGSAGRRLGADPLAALLTAPHAPAALSDEESSRLNAADLSAAPDAVRADVPDWLVPSLRRGLGDNWIAEAAALAERPPLDIRVNRLKADRLKVARELGATGAAETPFAPEALRIPPIAGAGRHPNLQSEPGFQKGWFEIQDEGSQIASLLVGAAPGHQVLDLCAGGGGKTLALAGVMGNKGQIHATDADKHRLAPIFDRLKRAGTRNVQVHNAGTDLSAFANAMDRVLIDAPCTGSGTWRRRPDIKWRLTERALGERLAEQAALLRQGAGFVKPGGLLVYVTCSVLPEENEDQAASFLSDRTGFAAVPAADLVAAAGLSQADKFLEAVQHRPVGLQITPLRTATDGFFVAAFRRGAA
jgi:16S rRNA (cytosine967-C5)-methyltransferase